MCKQQIKNVSQNFFVLIKLFLLTGIFDRSSNICFLALFPICFQIFDCKRKRENPDTFFRALTTKNTWANQISKK